MYKIVKKEEIMYKNNMREIRTKQGIKLKVLSKETEISIGYLSHLEKGNYIVNVFLEDKIIGNAKIIKL